MGLRTWLRRVLDIPTSADLQGLSIAYTDAVEVPAPRDLARLIRACGLMPSGSILYLEGGTHPPDLRQFLDAHQVPQPTKLAPHTIWPRPRVDHVPIAAGTIEYLAGVAEKVAGPELCIHLCVHDNTRVLVSAPDAPGDPVLISKTLPAEIIDQFSKALRLGSRSVS
jgi:hypothetical protein